MGKVSNQGQLTWYLGSLVWLFSFAAVFSLEGFHPRFRKRKPPPGVIEGQRVLWEPLVWVSQSGWGWGCALSLKGTMLEGMDLLRTKKRQGRGVEVFLRVHKAGPCVQVRV